MVTLAVLHNGCLGPRPKPVGDSRSLSGYDPWAIIESCDARLDTIELSDDIALACPPKILYFEIGQYQLTGAAQERIRTATGFIREYKLDNGRRIGSIEILGRALRAPFEVQNDSLTSNLADARGVAIRDKIEKNLGGESKVVWGYLKDRPRPSPHVIHWESGFEVPRTVGSIIAIYE